MSKHTPGPWKILHDPVHGGPLVATEDVAIADVMEMEGGMSKANARLIAAAPELLAACESSVARCQFNCTPESYCGRCGPLLVVIAKAGG